MPAGIMLPKTRAYVKNMMDKLNGFIFLTENNELFGNIILFGIKSALISKKNLIVSLSTITIFKNQENISWIYIK